jgi:AcrR family transcriptional regulator
MSKATPTRRTKANELAGPPGLQRPGGRTEDVRKLVAVSVLALIQEGNIAFSYSDVSAATGVNRTTLYRRWPARADLIREALNEYSATIRIPSGERWPDCCVSLIQGLARFLSKPSEIAMNVAMIADPAHETNVLLVEQWRPIWTTIVQLAKDAQARGELDPEIDTNILMAMVVAPLLMRTVVERGSIDRQMVASMIDIVTRMEFSR